MEIATIGTVLEKTVELIVRVVGQPLYKEILSIKDHQKDADLLAETIGFIGDLLNDTESVRFNGKSAEINAYNRLRSLYLDAEDFLDEVQTRTKMRAAEDMKMKQAEEEIHANGRGVQFVASATQHKIKSFVKKIPDSLSWSTPIKRHKAIKEFRKNLEAIKQDLRLFGPLKEHNNMETTKRRTRETGSYVDASSIVGRDKDKRKIIDLLFGACTDQGHIPVISIVGIGGMGKTTVAQLVYGCWVQGHESESKFEFKLRGDDISQFDLKMWVSDSQKFDLILLLQKILKSICPDGSDLQNYELDTLQTKLQSQIRGKKYLLVLDDVENENRKNWIQLEEILKLGAKGSKILVTTRSREVAKVMSSSDTLIHELKGLSKEDSWLLFENMAFRESKDEKLVQIGREIVQKYGGVPLAIKAIGCLLYGAADNRWERVRDRHISNIKDGDQNLGNIKSSDDIIPVLRISYDALSPEEKECFRYCSLFPKSGLILKRMLMYIWMSNLHIKTSRDQQKEDVLEDILLTLCNRGFLQKMEGNLIYELVEYFKMHDLMHDLAKEVAGVEMFVVDSDVTLGSGTISLEENIRHLSLTCNAKNYEQISRLEHKGRRLRTLIQDDIFSSFENNSLKKFMLSDFFDKLKSDFSVLRMLDLKGSCIDRLPDCVGDLIHLRYLDLSKNPFNSLPDSIGKLWNLESLLLWWCEKLEKLPADIHKLINLRHLGLEGCDALAHPMPSGMGALKSLCTLSKFIVGDSESGNTVKLEELKFLLNLRGKLEIVLPKKSTLKEEAVSGELVLLNKRQLMILMLQWPSSRYKRPVQEREEYVLASEDLGNGDMDILKKLQPPSDLRELKVCNYEGLRFPTWGDALGSSSLVVLEIDGSVKCQHLPSFSKLPFLEIFIIRHLLSLEYMEENVPAAGAHFFPSLERFELYRLPKLKGWCSELVGEEEQFSLLPSFPNHLAQLFIQKCPTLKMTSMPPAPFFPNFGLDCNSELDMKEPCVICFREELLREEDKNENENEFSVDNVQLLMSMPWERIIRSIHTVLYINRINVFNIEPASIVEASFRRMPKYITSLQIMNIPEFKIFPKALRHLSDLQELLIVDCNDFTGECEEPSDPTSIETRVSNASETWEGFEQLRCLYLSGLPKLVRLPMKILSLTSLQALDIHNCPELKYIQDNKSATFSFPSLETIKLYSLPNLKDWCKGQSLPHLFPRVSHLYILDCPSFNENSILLTYVTEFFIGRWSWYSTFPKSYWPSQSLSCALYTDGESLCKTAMLEQYHRGNPLTVAICQKGFDTDWRELDLERVSSRITSLHLEESNFLYTPPQGLKHLTALQSLSIVGYNHSLVYVEKGIWPGEVDEDVEMPWGWCAVGRAEIDKQREDGKQFGLLKSLTHLVFKDLSKMKTLPEWVWYIPSLQEVHISGCDKLELPDWIHINFDYVSLLEQQGSRLVRKSIDGSLPLRKQQQ